MSHSQVLVEIASLPYLVVRFVDGVEQVRQDHKDLDSSTMVYVLSGSWLRLGLSSTNPHGIVCSLNPPSNQLRSGEQACIGHDDESALH